MYTDTVKDTVSDRIDLTVLSRFLNYKFRSQSGGFCVLRLEVLDVTCNNQVLTGPATLFDNKPDIPSTGNIITAVGILPDLSLNNGMELVVSGHWDNSKYGRQLQIRSLTIADPVDEKGIFEYLSSGIIKGIGPGLARRIIEHFGVDTLKILDQDPKRLLEVKGIGEKSLEGIVCSWNGQRVMARLLMSICSLGLTVTYARKVLEAFGNDANELILQNPYVLTKIDGIGFLRADRIARNLGVPEDSPLRIRAATVYCLQEASYSEGHCYLPEDDLLNRVTSVTGLDKGKIMDVIGSGSNGDFLYTSGRFYLPKIHRAEEFVSRRLSVMAESKPLLSPAVIHHPSMTDEQYSAIRHVFQSLLSVITGGPGTGKTTTVRFLVDILEHNGISYCLAAPTGKAAKRLSEATGCEATTLHRLLEYRDGNFTRNEHNPLPYDFIIIDESSMIDILLMETLLRAVRDGAALVLVGDVDQLPSVGPGNILGDIIRQRPSTCKRLYKVHRQAEGSAIITAAHMINRGRNINTNVNGKDLQLIHEEDPAKILDTVVSLVRDHPVFKPQDIQVLSPVKRGDLGVHNLNNIIRESLSRYNLSYALDLTEKTGLTPARGPSIPSWQDPGCIGSAQLWQDSQYGLSVEEMKRVFGFIPGDRVIQIKNNYEKEVFNGEVGYVVDLDPEERTLVVLYDGRAVSYKDTELDQLQLAYALTVHKSQGSEFPMVVLVMHTSHYVMLYRNLLYTAVTRAKDMLVVIGTMKAINIAVKNNRPTKRYTGLLIDEL